MTRTVLLFDIGNSGAKAALCEMVAVTRANPDGTEKWELRGDVVSLGRVPTESVDSAWLFGCAESLPQSPAIAFSSVVPRVTEMIRAAFPASRTWQVRGTEDLGWPMDYPDRHALGGDRICAAAGARLRYPGRRLAAVDFGTATTFNVVSEHGAFIGGVIAPGWDMMLGYLHDKTAQLPRLKPVESAPAVGRNTREAMESAALYGYEGLVKGILQSIGAELAAQSPGKLTVVMTGGYAEVMARRPLFTEDWLEEVAVRPLLNLEGLASMAAYALRSDLKRVQ